MRNPDSQPSEVVHLLGAAREAQRVCRDDGSGAVGVLDALLGDIKHVASGTELKKLPRVIMEFELPPRAGVPKVSATQLALGRRRTLQVFVHGARAGDLHNESGVWSFCYARAWASSGNWCALTPEIPLQKKPIVDSETIRPVQRYFESLLPDDRARISLAALTLVDAADSFSLLGYIGAKSADYHLGDYPDFIQLCAPPIKRAQAAYRR